MRLGRLLVSACGMTQLYTGTLHALVADASVHLQEDHLQMIPPRPRRQVGEITVSHLGNHFCPLKNCRPMLAASLFTKGEWSMFISLVSQPDHFGLQVTET